VSTNPRSRVCQWQERTYASQHGVHHEYSEDVRGVYCVYVDLVSMVIALTDVRAVEVDSHREVHRPVAHGLANLLDNSVDA
jgi:hypothetical protein